MTYYITALSQYSELAPCAQSAVSYEFFSVSRARFPTQTPYSVISRPPGQAEPSPKPGLTNAP